MRTILYRAGMAATLIVVASCAGVKSPQKSPLQQAENRADPLPVMQAVADWQLTQMKSPETYPAKFNNRTWDSRGWIQGVFFAGLTELASRSGQARFADAIAAHGTVQNWRLGDRLTHADDHVIGQSYVWEYARSHDAIVVADMRKNFDAILAAPPKVSLDFNIESPTGGDRPCQVRWCWCDALFMSPPAWAGLSKVLNDPRYLNYADAEWWATTDYLYDRDAHLYYRDSRFFAQRDEDGHKIFWSRGNGWVFGGIVRMLEVLPANHPSRPRYEALLREMAATLVGLQSANGYWPVSLLAGERYTVPETSGTGFFVYGLAWGVNHGLLDRTEYGPAIERGWAALLRAVGPDGKIGWVQQVGFAPDQVTADDTQFYGVGAFLLAGSQVRELHKVK